GPAARGTSIAALTGTVRTEYAAKTPATAISSVSVQVFSRLRQSTTRVAASSTANAPDRHESQSGGSHSAKNEARSPTATTPPYRAGPTGVSAAAAAQARVSPAARTTTRNGARSRPRP